MKKVTLTAPQTAVLMAIFVMGSKVIGFIRELVLANYYGTGIITDSYVMAQSIPNTLLAGVIGAAATAYMPIFSRKIEQEGDEEANRYTSQLFNFLIAVTGIAAIIGVFFSRQLVDIFAPGYGPEAIELTSFYLKIGFLIVLFNTSIALFEAFLQYKGVFLSQIVLGYTQSLSIIFITIISAYTTHYLLIFGALLGFSIRGIGSFLLAKRNSFHYISDWHFTKAVKESMILALPIFIGGSVNQINTFIDRVLASQLQTGSVSALNYGNMVVGVISMFSVTIFITIIYPKLNQAFAHEEYSRISDMAEKGIDIIVLLAVPFTLGSMCYSGALIQVIYERGAFDGTSTLLTSAAFFYYAIGLTFISLNALITKIFYSLHDTKTTVVCSAIAVVCNIILNLILVKFMYHAGLALATSIAQTVNTLLLYLTFKRKYPQIQLLRSKTKVIKIIIFSTIAIGFSYVFFIIIGNRIWMPRMVLLGLTVTLAMLLYLALLHKAKFEELDLIKDLFRRGSTPE